MRVIKGDTSSLDCSSNDQKLQQERKDLPCSEAAVAHECFPSLVLVSSMVMFKEVKSRSKTADTSTNAAENSTLLLFIKQRLLNRPTSTIRQKSICDEANCPAKIPGQWGSITRLHDRMCLGNLVALHMLT